MITHSLIFNEDEDERFIVVVQQGHPDLIVDEDFMVWPSNLTDTPTTAAIDRAAHLCAPYEYWLRGERLPQDDDDFTEALSLLYNT